MHYRRWMASVLVTIAVASAAQAPAPRPRAFHLLEAKIADVHASRSGGRIRRAMEAGAPLSAQERAAKMTAEAIDKG